jgi:hypothetical protein
MNNTQYVLGSIINPQHNHQIAGSHLFYIGTGIGLSSGLLCACIIAHYKYIKFKARLATRDVPKGSHNDKDDSATIAVIIDYFDSKINALYSS